jgi:hypothetical protein
MDGAPYRFRDPARFSLAHGGKDRHPYPVPIKVYDETTRGMESAVRNAKLARDEEMQALNVSTTRRASSNARLKDPCSNLSSPPSAPHLRCWMAGPYSDGKKT